MKIGIIGTGNMGTILTESLIESSAVASYEVVVTNRTLEKAYRIQQKYPDVTVARTPEEVADKSEITFVCIKPLDIHALLLQIRHHLRDDQLLISITSPIKVEQIESMVNCSVARVIPSITNRALSGATLLTFGTRCSDEQKNSVKMMVEKFSNPVVIDESVTRVASDLCSCGPAFISYLLIRLIDAAVSETDISEEQATELTSQMVIGLGKLMEKNIYTLEDLKEKVNVRGGITGEGLNVIESEFGDVFEHVIERTHSKFREDHEHVDKQFEAYTNSN